MVVMLKRKMASLHSGPASLATADTARDRGARWQSVRARVIRRDAGLCCYCQAFGHMTTAAEVDHTRPLWAGGSDSEANLRSICLAHHRAKTRAEERTRQAGAAWSPWQAEPTRR